MRTTLKRGSRPRAATNGNGHAVLPPALVAELALPEPEPAFTRYRQPPPPRRGVARMLLAGVLWLFASAAVVAQRPGRRRVPLPRGRRRRRDQAARPRGPRGRRSRSTSSRRTSRRSRSSSATTSALGREAEVDSAALRHDHARPRRPATEDRSRCSRSRATCSSTSTARASPSFADRINAAYSPCGAKGTLETVRRAHRAADQLPDHGQLPRLQAARRAARRRLGRRRPALLQRQPAPASGTRRSTSSPATRS